MSDSYDSDSDDSCDDLWKIEDVPYSVSRTDQTAVHQGYMPITASGHRQSYQANERGSYGAASQLEMAAMGITKEYDAGVPFQSNQQAFVSGQPFSNSMFEQQGQSAQINREHLELIKKWVEMSNYNILVCSIFGNMGSLEQILNQSSLPIEWMRDLVKIFKNVVLGRSQKWSLDIIALVMNSDFFETKIKHFLQQLQRHRLRKEVYSVLRDILDVIDYVMKNLPTFSHKCYASLCIIKEEGRELNILKYGNDLTVRLSHLLRKIEQTIPQFVQQHNKKERRIKEIPRADEEAPPDDFSTKTIFPDLEELEASYEPFLRANKTTGVYRDVQHYTDVHFRLLREDYLSPIRNGIKDYKGAIQQNQEVKSRELRFYFDVQLVQMKTDERNGITFMVKFDNKNLGEVNWEFTSRFMFGALLCFSKDNFDTVIFATVAEREPVDHEEGRVKVVFETNLEDVFTSSEYDVYVMAETVSFFESYRHVLEGLQEIKEVPLSRYIVQCKRKIHPPQYINENTCFDFTPIMKNGIEKKVNLLSSTDWPDADDTILNDSQLEALNLALTSELGIIQGPPGTGKTYIGLKIMELLLKNKNETDSVCGPILVVCYTNHALDQFLEGILEFCPNGIVRVGKRSKSQALECFNLSELVRSRKISKFIKKDIDKKLRDTQRRLKEICRRIKILWHESLQLETSILTVDDLEDEISDTHLISLTDKSRSDGESSKIMNQWMKSASANMGRHINESAKRHLVKIIIGEGDSLQDSGLLSKIGMVRPDFETRILIYRGWVQKLRADLNERLNVVLGLPCPEKERLKFANEIRQEIDKTYQDILPDEIITKYMTCPDVYESIRKCVESECGEQFQSSYVRSWLLDYFRSCDQILDAVARIAQKTRNLITKSDHRGNSETPCASSGWTIAISDDSDDDSDMGFDIRDDDDEESPDEQGEETIKFKEIEADFKYSEKREISWLQKAKLLGIDLYEETDTSEPWQMANKMTYSKVFKLLHAKDPFSPEEAASISDVWNLSLPERYRLYKYWMLEKKAKLASKIIDLTKQYNFFLQRKRITLNRKKIAILKGAQVIGMTTTGAARNREVLKRVAPQIIVVEEAAEVLEAHIITTLNKNCKHLILIGDQQQLRPNPTVHRLAVDYNFEISLFERLVKNDLPMVRLKEQHRMRPAIANYLRLIYPDLVDHEKVLYYNDVEGVSSNVFFLHHEYQERNILDSTSKENTHEAEFLRELCKYFLHHGYQGDQITILAAYGGQVALLQEYMKENEEYEHVKLTSIDNYQGEENDIILLSLVRSNLIEEVGFLKIANRVCVALSRARKGLFVIGNLKLLSEQSKLWKRIMELAHRTGTTGSAMKLMCVNHNDHFSYVRNAKDFENKVPEGGCNIPCNAQLDCGHTCPRLCHASDREHLEQICRQDCLKSCKEGHRCKKKCYEDCGLCEFLVEKKLTICGHIDLVQCFQDEETACCGQLCGQKLSCGHICEGLCGNCLEAADHSPCNQRVQRTWPCSHISIVPCHTDVREYPCPAKCTSSLQCGHKCKGTCGECLGGKVHKVCSHRCEKILPCGHQCLGKCGAQCSPCQERCPLLCRHGLCSKSTCGELCEACMENCDVICKHQHCYERCADECSKSPCKRKCPLRTKCQHSCSSLCGEECVCLTCEHEKFSLLDFSKKRPDKTIPLASKERAAKFKPDRETLLMKIPRCGHIFTLSQLDHYVEGFDPDDSHYIRCPCCKNTIQGIFRYKKHNKSHMMRRENRKIDLIKSFSIPDSVLEECSATYQLTSNQLEQLDPNRLKAIKFQDIFTSVLKRIQRMHEHFNWTIEFKVGKWKNVILSLQTRVTSQFIEEMSMEFYRLLIIEQIVALRRMVDDFGYSLEDPLKLRCKMVKQLQQKLNVRMKNNAEDLLKDLYEVVHTFQGDSKLEQDVKDLLTTSESINSMLDQLITGEK